MQSDTETHGCVGKLLGRQRDKLGWTEEAKEDRERKKAVRQKGVLVLTDIWIKQIALYSKRDCGIVCKIIQVVVSPVNTDFVICRSKEQHFSPCISTC